MSRICSSQIKAARALLGWSQRELAGTSGLSIATIRKVELGSVPRYSTMDALRKVIERAGVEFTDGEGVRKSVRDIKVLNHASELIADIVSTLKGKDLDVCAVVKTQNILIEVFGMNVDPPCVMHSPELKVKALISQADDVFKLPELFECRIIPESHLSPVSYVLYGNKHALILKEGCRKSRFIVFNSTFQTKAYKTHFQPLWDIAFPISDIHHAHERFTR